MRAAIALLWTGCVASDGVDRGAPPERVGPGEPGPYGVGVVTRTIERAEGLPLTVEVWYPAQVDRDAEVEPYDPFLRLALAAHRDAPPDTRESLPLVAFSHGFGGVRFQSASLTEHLASHGFVVVAPDHPRNHLHDMDFDATSDVAARRPGDVSDAVDWLVGEGAASLGLQAHLDPRAYGIVGHSFGAWTALVLAGGRIDVAAFSERCASEGGRACGFIEGQPLDASIVADHGQPDPRVAVAVALAPGGYYAFGADGAGLSGLSATTVVAGTRDDELPYDTEARPTWERLGEGATLVTLEGAGHWAFTDLCGFLPLSDCAGAAGGFMDPAVVAAHTRAVTTAALRGVLRGEDALGISAADGVTVERRGRATGP